jgi:hypothetical protein
MEKLNICISLSTLGLLFYFEVGGSKFLRNVGNDLSHYTPSHPERK